MTRDEIIKLALEARLAFDCDDYPDIWQTYMNVGREEIERFAALVAAAERKAIEPIVYGLCISDNNAQEIVTAIRKRGQG